MAKTLVSFCLLALVASTFAATQTFRLTAGTSSWIVDGEASKTIFVSPGDMLRFEVTGLSGNAVFAIHADIDPSTSTIAGPVDRVASEPAVLNADGVISFFVTPEYDGSTLYYLDEQNYQVVGVVKVEDVLERFLQLEECGDGIVNNVTEQCDSGADCNANCTCEAGFRPTTPPGPDCEEIPSCGNNALDAGEECDGGPFCEANCTCPTGYEAESPNGCAAVPTCGNGIAEGTEECDDGTGCAADCTCNLGYEPKTPASSSCQPVCGNGERDAGEECDGGTNCGTDCTCDAGYEPASSTSTNCVPDSFCGNDQRDAGEQCDGGDFCDSECECNSGYEPISSTSVDCTLSVVCGNGVAQSGEECDGGSNCGSDCECNTGYQSTSPPSAGCVLIPTSVCGDDIAQSPEQCDGGANCASNCVCNAGFQPTSPLTVGCVAIDDCGNDELDSGEECDGGVGCLSNCECDTGYQPTIPTSTDCVTCNVCPPGFFQLTSCTGICYTLPCPAFACGLTSYDINCAYSETSDDYTCTCPDGYSTVGGAQSEDIPLDADYYFSGCFSPDNSPPSVNDLLEHLATDAGISNLELAIQQAANTIAVSSVTVTAISNGDQTVSFTVSLTPGTSADTVIERLKAFFSRLLNVATDQVNIIINSDDGSTFDLVVVIDGDTTLTVSSAPSFGQSAFYAVFAIFSMFMFHM